MTERKASRKRVKRLVLECRKCHWKWAPSPIKWRNTFNSEGRALKCPKCGTVNHVHSLDMKQILKLNH